MNWLLVIKGALLALPELVKEFRELRLSVSKLGDTIIHKHMQKVRGEVNEITKKIDVAETDEDLRKLINDLSNAVNK